MLDRLKALFETTETSATARRAGTVDLELAVAAMLVEAAGMDDTFDAAERATIERVLAERFALSGDAVRETIADAEARMASSQQYHPFAQRISQELSIEERAKIIEMMWEVAYADGELDPQEDMLLRQVAGLLHVPDRDRGLARKRALARLGLQSE